MGPLAPGNCRGFNVSLPPPVLLATQPYLRPHVSRTFDLEALGRRIEFFHPTLLRNSVSGEKTRLINGFPVAPNVNIDSTLFTCASFFMYHYRVYRYANFFFRTIIRSGMLYFLIESKDRAKTINCAYWIQVSAFHSDANRYFLTHASAKVPRFPLRASVWKTMMVTVRWISK